MSKATEGETHQNTSKYSYQVHPDVHPNNLPTDNHININTLPIEHGTHYRCLPLIGF